MKRRTAACPACGAPVEFKIGSSLVTICEFCQTAVARKDKKIEDHGKVADLVQTNSPLRLGLSGRFLNKRFSIVGRVQYDHPAGGVWEEWYLAFPGDRWGWLAEAQGSLFLMFERQLSSSIRLPDLSELQLQKRLRLGQAEFTVTEIGVAKVRSGEGEIPWSFDPDAAHQFVDLEGSEGAVATLEYGPPDRAFVGQEVALGELEIEKDVWRVDDDNVSVESAQLNCPKCGGPLTLHAPDLSERVTCQNCNSLLDASGGKLQYFATLKTAEKLKVRIPLGSQGRLNGIQYTVIGFLGRFARYEGTIYPWSEYLLYNPDVGFRWLVENDHHWSFVEPISAHVQKGTTWVEYKSDRFRLYERGTSFVRHVLGEFYWKVAVGERVRTADYIKPPRMISIETSGDGESREVNVSLGTYLTPETVESAFGLQLVGRSWGVGMIQPRPSVGIGVFVMWFLFTILVLIIHAAFDAPTRPKPVDPWMTFYAFLFLSLMPIGLITFVWTYEVKRWENSDYSPYRSNA